MDMLPIDPKEYYGPIVEELQKLRKEVAELRRENKTQREALVGLLTGAIILLFIFR